tara:strand:+ start:553 stop:669 length:117 start_codon:yes stop_codon:yes gene_type:complete
MNIADVQRLPLIRDLQDVEKPLNALVVHSEHWRLGHWL